MPVCPTSRNPQDGGGVSPAAPLGGMRQNEQVETGEQEQKEWGQRRVDDPGGSFPQSHGGEVGDDGQRKDDRQPAVDLPNPFVPIQWDLLSQQVDAADFSPPAPGAARASQRTAAIRAWRPGRPAADLPGSLTAPCAGGSQCSLG